MAGDSSSRVIAIEINLKALVCGPPCWTRGLLSQIGIPIGAKETLSFALLTLECYVRRPMIVPKRIELDRLGLVGQIQLGKNMHRIRQHVAKVG